MKGILFKDVNNYWCVKYPNYEYYDKDYFFCFELSFMSDSIFCIENNKIINKPLEEGVLVEFEKFCFYDKNRHRFSTYVKLIFPEVDLFKKKKRIKEMRIETLRFFMLIFVSNFTIFLLANQISPGIYNKFFYVCFSFCFIISFLSYVFAGVLIKILKFLKKIIIC